jgi:hypothetical protein
VTARTFLVIKLFDSTVSLTRKVNLNVEGNPHLSGADYHHGLISEKTQRLLIASAPDTDVSNFLSIWPCLPNSLSLSPPLSPLSLPFPQPALALAPLPESIISDFHIYMYSTIAIWREQKIVRQIVRPEFHALYLARDQYNTHERAQDKRIVLRLHLLDI